MKKFAILMVLCALTLWAQNPNPAVFPSAVATDSNLFVANNRPAIQKTLNGNLTNIVTTIVLSAGGYLAPTIISVDSEIIYCTTITGPTLSGCSRGMEGTAAASHSTGANVYQYLTEGYTNQFAAELKAIESFEAARTGGYAAGGGTAQAQSVTLTPPLPALSNGVNVCWLPAAANTAAAPTLAVNGLTATAITKYGNTALVASDITTSAMACARYNSAGPRFELQNPQTNTGGGGGGVVDATAIKNGQYIALSSGSGTTYAGSPTTAPTVLAAGQVFEINIDVTNSTTTPSLNVNSLGAKTIVNADGSALALGQLVVGRDYFLNYDATYMRLIPYCPIAGSTGTITITTCTVDVTAGIFPQLAGTNTYTGANDFSGASNVHPIPVLAIAPGTCTVGQEYFNSGNTLTYSCTAANTWTAFSSSGASGTVSSASMSFTGGLLSVAGSPITTVGTFALTVAGTSGGIPYFSASNTWASSAALTAHGVVIGEGGGTAPTSTAAGTSGQCLISNGSAADPTFQSCGGGGSGPDFTTASQMYISFMGGAYLYSNGSFTVSNLTANTVYCFMVPAQYSITVNYLEAWLINGAAAGKASAFGVYSAAGSRLSQGAVTAPSGQPQAFTLSPAAQLIAAGTTYYFCGATEDSGSGTNTTSVYKSLIDSATTAQMYNNGTAALRIVTAQNPSTGTGGSFSLPATLGTLTANNGASTNVPYIYGMP